MFSKDRKSDATFGSIFDTGGLSQWPTSHQEVLGAAIKFPQRCLQPGREPLAATFRATGTSHP